MTYTELLQSIEFWAGFNSGDITDDTDLKQRFTFRLNRHLERYLGMLGAGSHIATVDDTNYTEHPFSYFDIEENVHDYEFLADEDDNAISDITAVLIKSGDNFNKIERVTIDHPMAELIMSPNPSRPGRPYRFLERNNTIFVDPVPNYALDKGGKLFYKRVPSYFAVTDTIKQPGIPVQFHEMLAMASARDHLLVHKSGSLVEISRVEVELDKMESKFRTYNELRSPQQNRIVPRVDSAR